MTVLDHQASTNPRGAPEPDPGPPAKLRVVAWRDPVVDAMGVDPRSLYTEKFWLPVIGPTCTWLLRRLAARLEDEEAGFVLDLDDTARELGLGGHRGRHSPFSKALSRCVTFELARWQGQDTIGVRRMLPSLARRHVARLTAGLQAAHQEWTGGPRSVPTASTASTASTVPTASTLDGHRRRARRLALGLVALAEPFDAAEAQLLRWGVHPSLIDEAVRWARATAGAGPCEAAGPAQVAGPAETSA